MNIPISSRDGRYILPPLIASGIATMASNVSPFPLRTTALYGFEGDLVSLFQSVTHPAVTKFFILIYVGVYPLLLVLTYVGLKRERGNRHIDYGCTYTATIVVATPFFTSLLSASPGISSRALNPCSTREVASLARR